MVIARLPLSVKRRRTGRGSGPTGLARILRKHWAGDSAGDDARQLVVPTCTPEPWLRRFGTGRQLSAERVISRVDHTLLQGSPSDPTLPMAITGKGLPK